ncbi:MAG: nicotinamide-nucleotide amidohydrolase family protein [Gammaproteobacteria bacterium]|nr:nicotinamide-nucleotide amidohydrolase family protein [Gammaproteobacteria bacterium]MCW8841762.1 nicotinamide-nucleotide amidohydrolase family protein [Gammaproteobacteria bacterium]MCW8958618.1 nicotinamide-nucleotide amidohydrolase family protein [Gammaproteobacteria bacterium]MCW8973099.1 nicotinamide-nucleotide amidohydrolase family protein [Gammaproteobacteria bacterium]MCW8993216.1 nicotinamide-nucleotide amidohydrolase family protein [Gammaproteobacteria bacterium]
MSPDDKSLQAEAQEVAERLCRRGWLLAAAESCTGGWLAKVCTDLPGSSAWFERGFVTYTNQSKQEMLGVRAETLAAHGAVSEATVTEMAAGALHNSRAQISVAISGIAGPGGGSAEKPLGTVCFAWGIEGEAPQSERCRFDGDREQVRRQAVLHALQGVARRLDD